MALDGMFVQEDETRGRRLFCYVRSFLVASRDVDAFVDHLSRQDLGGRWLPEKPDVIYAFAGEIPWCDTFPENGLSEFSFVAKEYTVKVEKVQPEFYLDGEKLGWSETELHLRRVLGGGLFESEERQRLSDEDLNRIEVRETLIEVEELKKGFATFNALIPVCDFGWEGHQTVASDAGHATTLAREIASDLELVGQPQSFDLFTMDGRRATCNISDQSDDYNNHQRMFFIREGLSKSYLKQNDLTLVWAIWGEREYSSDQVLRSLRGPDRAEPTYAVYSLVKRYEWPN